MGTFEINRRINVVLRSLGRNLPTVYAFDREKLETYRHGRFNITKMTADWGATLFCISQDGEVMYLDGDPHQKRWVSGEWEDWLASLAGGVAGAPG
ncbi:MAG: hypothetical protein AAFY57_19345 [Cyanobacteria bacterium J06642_2]